MDSMSNHDIGKALSKYSSFLGVFAADINPLPLIRSFPCCFVMNTKSRTVKSGGHWLAFYLINPFSLEFFDSLGLSIQAYPYISTYFSHINEIKDTRICFQAEQSNLCGDYCITFLSLRIYTNSFPSSVNIIKSKPKGNSRESFVRRFRLLNQK